MKMSIGEIIDRYSICKLKTERLQLDNSKELDLLHNEIEKYGINIYDHVETLYKINGNIWDLEADIRQGKIDELGFEEIGRRAIQIRDFNNQRVSTKNEINSKYNDGFVEVKMNHGSEKEKSVIITLTTVPERLKNLAEHGIKKVIESLCQQSDTDYEVHFNIPHVYNVTGEEYILPDWLNDFKLQYPHLKVFRTDDIGPSTKFAHTIKRITNPETILITVDDDLIYHQDMVSEHRKYQAHLLDSVICYEGRGLKERIYDDVRDGIVICVDRIVETNGLQHYKSASYKRKLFREDFYDYYLGRTLSDDILVSKYFTDKNVKMFVVPYEKDMHLFSSLELWKQNSGVETFPVLKHANAPSQTGCNHPEMLKVQPKFYESPTIGNRSMKTVPVTFTSNINVETSMQLPQVQDKPTNIIQALQVYNVNSQKIRLGNAHDGGYVINELIAQHTKKLISIGMGGEDTFERNWFERYKTDIEAYDGTYPCAELCNTNREHVNKKIFYTQHNVGYDEKLIPLNCIIDGKTDVLLKVDVEGAEYKIFDNVNLNNVSGLILEVHDLHIPEKVEKFIDLLTNNFKDLVLFHIHGNSWGGMFDLNLSKKVGQKGIVVKDFPHTIELTFINKKLINQCELETGNFPVQNLDVTNRPDQPDIDLYWVNSL